MTTSDEGPTSRSLGGVATALLLGLLATGIGLAAWLTLIKLRLEFDPTYVSSCNIGDGLNCDAVQTSEWSEVAGYPLAVLGLATYAAIALGLVAAWLKPAWSRAMHAGLGLASVVIVLHTAWLVYVSKALIGSFCIFCMGMYCVNVGLMAVALVTYRRRHGRWLDPAALVAQPAAAGVAVAALALSAAVALPGFGLARDGMKETRLAQVEAEIAELEAAVAKTTAPAGAVGEGGGSEGRGSEVEGAAASGSGAGAASAARASRPAAPHKPIGDEITRKGRAYYEVPVFDDDWVYGAADAKVTVVEFADFKCGYCRVLTKNFAPLKERYKDRVRWVFRHFPMDRECNLILKDTQHVGACRVAHAANCAGEQGLFWPMHDRLFDQAHKQTDGDLRAHAVELGADGGRFDACMARTEPDPRIARDLQHGRVAKIAGTPRMYIDGHLVPGVHVLEYYLNAALERAEARDAARAAGEPEVALAPPRPSGMVEATKAGGATFWIDAYEGSIAVDGKAVSRAGVMPALTSWFDASKACAAAGKRMCSEEEWISACTGTPAVDNDGNGDFTDDAIEGQMFPYGLFYQPGACHDQEPKKGGSPVATGSLEGCRTPAGVFDQAGNLAEWTGLTEETAVVTGPYFAYGQKAACTGRSERFGPGYRNETTGFRCCADHEVTVGAGLAVAPLAEVDLAEVGSQAPAFEVTGADGARITEAFFKGKVTIVSFFASWCGPCRRELPSLQELFAEHGKRGLQVLAIGVDTEEKAARDFVETLKLSYTVAFDGQAVSMGRFGVKGMPTAFLVDSEGIVQDRLVGMNEQEVTAFKAKAVGLLGR